MLKEKHPLIKLELKSKKGALNIIIQESYNALFTLYYLILEDTIENFIYEMINIIIGYLQLIIFIFDYTVRLFYKISLSFLYIFIVSSNMEPNRISKRNNKFIEIYTFHTYNKRKGISLLYNNFFYNISYIFHGNFNYNNDNYNK